MKLLLTGRNGQVGFELRRALATLGEVVAFDRATLDLADAEAIRRRVRDVRPDVIVNPVAYTAVDRAESEPAQAHAINGTAPGVLGEEAARLGALVVHYSTDYVFDGTKAGPYVETDAPAPLNEYGRSKLAGERALAASGARHYIFRTSWVFGHHGANFARTILRLARERETLNVVADQHGAPTSAALIADVTAHVIARVPRDGAAASGIYHLAAAGETQWHDYARTVVATAAARGVVLKLRPDDVRPITTADYPTPARRPANSRLETRKLRETFSLTLPSWQDGLSHELEQMI